jgi:hypothetical protein
MILTQDNEYAAVLDACVLVPMPLCDTLLRLAEDPAMYRPLWNDAILAEVGTTLKEDLGLTPEQVERRLRCMRNAFPEASITIPDELCGALVGIPDANDRHVLAAAIQGHAHAIVTRNVKHFPEPCLQSYNVLCQTPDDFLMHQFHLNPLQVLEKLDAQASAIQQGREKVIALLKPMAPQFIALVEKWTT